MKISRIAVFLLIIVYKLDNIVSIENNMILERIECEEPNHDLISELRCEMRPVASNVFKVNLTLQMRKPLNNIWIRTTLYHRYSTYQKFGEQEENVCSFLSNIHDQNKTTVLKMVFDNLKYFTNLTRNLKCPMSAFVFTSSGFNVSHYVVPLLPAARYRVDSNITLGRNGRYIASSKAFFRISDFRIWVWK